MRVLVLVRGYTHEDRGVIIVHLLDAGAADDWEKVTIGSVYLSRYCPIDLHP